MKKIAAVILFATVSLVVHGQGRPAWLDDDFRQMRFPANEYVTGFAFAELPAGKSLQDAAAQMKTEAQADLIRKIHVQITSSLQIETSAVSQNRQYLETETFANRTTAESSAELTGLSTESFHDPATGWVYGFAFVKREDIANYYRRAIHQELGRAETAISLSKQLAEAGRKMSARTKTEKAKQIVDGVRAYRNLLVAIDSQADENGLQNDRESALLHTVERLLASLDRIATVYVDYRHEFRGGKDDAFDKDPGIFYDIVAQALSENDCIATNNREEADYELTLVASTSQRSDGTGEYGVLSYFANVKGSLYNRKTGMKTLDFTVFNDPVAYATGRSPDDAATRAFKLPALKDKVMEQILPKIRE